MKPWNIAAALVVGASALAGGLAALQPTEAQAEQAWHKDYGAARLAARRANKPLLLVFR